MSTTTVAAGEAPEDLGLFSPEFIADPYPVYARLRERQPVFKTPFGFWLASRHEEVSQVVRDRRFGKDFARQQTAKYGEDFLKLPAVRSLSRMMLVLDPPDHTRLRGLVNKAFTTPRIEALRDRVQILANALVDEVEGRGRMDVIADFAHKLPVQVICDMLGIPESDRAEFLQGRNVSGRLIDPTPMSDEEMAEANARTLRSEAFFQKLFELRRNHPADDLTTSLVEAEEAGDRLTEQELASNVSLLFGAGHETTTNLIGNGLLALQRNPGEWERLKRGEIVWPDAIEELLRFDSSVQLTSRTVKTDVELGGMKIPRGDVVIALLGSANRDPRAYSEPDRLDLGRRGLRCMSFGGGIHICLGARLARLEGEVAFQTLVQRLPDLELDDVEQARWRQTYTLRGLDSLPAHW